MTHPPDSRHDPAGAARVSRSGDFAQGRSGEPQQGRSAGAGARSVSRRLPRNLIERDRWLFQRDLRTTLPEPSVAVHHDVDVFGRGPLRKQGAVLVESFVDPSHFRRWKREGGGLRAAAESWFQTPQVFESPAVWITDNWSRGYFHWMCDALPRLHVALARRPASELTLLLPSKFRRDAYFAESLRPFGLKDVRFLRRFERLRCRELLLPAHVAPSGNYSETVMQALRQQIRSSLAADDAAEAARRLYISRRIATRRRIANEPEILPVLAKHGFETVIAEQHPWHRQVRLASGAAVLVSNHGAGLTNMMVMAPGARVMEIREHRDDRLNCYFNLASAAELDYYYLLARRQQPHHSVIRADLIVDPERLDAQLTRMLHDQDSACVAAA